MAFEWKYPWWEGSASKIASNIGMRALYGILLMFRNTLRPFVWIPLLIGVFLLIFAEYTEQIAGEAESATRTALIALDVSISEVTGGLNLLTQEVPEFAAGWIDNVFQEIEDGANSILANAPQTISSTLNFLSRPIQQGINNINQEVRSQTGITSVPFISIPIITIPTANITGSGWRPDIFPLDLSSLLIPSFSISQELEFVVQETYEIPELVVFYLRIIAGILISYVGVVLVGSFFYAYWPKITTDKSKTDWASWLTCCLQCGKKTAQAFKRSLKQLAKPWVNIPLCVGIIMITLAVTILFTRIEEVRREIDVGLQTADTGIQGLINEVNELTVSLIELTNNYIRDVQVLIQNDVESAIGNFFTPIVSDINSAVQGLIEDISNVAINAMSGGVPVAYPSLNFNNLGVEVPQNFVPTFPDIPTALLVVPTNIISLEATIGYVTDKMLDEVVVLVGIFLSVGIFLAALPCASVIACFFIPFFPRKVRKFFAKPPWDNKSAKKPTKKKKRLSIPKEDKSEKEEEDTPVYEAQNALELEDLTY